MISITIEELEKNFDYYLEQSSKEDVVILKDGFKIAVFTNPETYSSLNKKPL